MTECLLAIGCNQGNCHENIRQAVQRIDKLPDTSVISVSDLLETTPVGAVQGKFLNGALRLKTALTADQLMSHLLQIETRGGRDRVREPGNRPIDLDVLLFGQQILSTDVLSVPHPRMSFRRFVLQPAVEIASDWLHPELKQTLAQLLEKICSTSNLIVVLPEQPMENWDVSSCQELELDHLDPDHLDQESQWPNVKWRSVVEAVQLLSEPEPDGDQWTVAQFAVSSNGSDVSSNDNGPLSKINDMVDLAALAESIKLLVVVGDNHTSTSQQKLIRHYRGPRWNLPHMTSAQLSSSIFTAIESMKPIEASPRP